MYLLIIFLPLLTSIFILLFGKNIGRSGISIVAVLVIFFCLLLSFNILNEIIICSTVYYLNLFLWVDIGYLNILFSIFIDDVTSLMFFVVLFISFFVHLYSVEYMKFDSSYPRFISYLSLFTFFMLFLVASDNYLQMFIGWEGVGLSSYLLISFWYTRILANKAAIKAMLVNRIGDLGFLIALALIFNIFYSFKYNVIFSLVYYCYNFKYLLFGININAITIICLFLLIGAIGKSAQLGLHVWLPDAMEGPTPVSALIHAATMVTAGVFLVIKSNVLFEYSSNVLFFITIIGGLTSLFSALIGSFQFDIKKVVAYSTCSQLGYMFFICGLSNYNVGLFHLFNHAFFKALLFLSMGSIIHALNDEQDLRKMGGIRRFLPITYTSVLIGSIALLGLPYLSGFYSKDLILELTYSIYTVNSIFLYTLGILSALLTSFYSIRLIYWIFFAKTNMFKIYFVNIHESKFFICFCLLCLCVLSIFIGYIFNDAFVGIGTLFNNSLMFLNINNYSIFEVEFDLYYIKFVPFFFFLLGVYLFFFLKKKINIYINNIYYIFIFNVFNKAMLFDYIYNILIIENLLKFSYVYMYKKLEKGLFEYFSYVIIIKTLNIFFDKIKYFNSGLIYNYIFNIIFFIVLLFFVFELFVSSNISIFLISLLGIYVTSW